MNTRAATASEVRSESQLGLTLMMITFRVSVVATLFVVAAIGLFAVAALIGGAVSAGGPVGLVQGWFSSVTGI